MRLIAAMLLLALATGPGRAADEKGEGDLLARGKGIVAKNCGRCHGVGRDDKSPHGLAPPFRKLSERYPVRSLEEALAEGIVTGHKDMPEFTFAPDEINAILSYIESLSPPK